MHASDDTSTRLIVLRHAKSSWPEGVSDHERPLSGRGRRDAPAVGRWLRQQRCVPDLVICSTSRRTRETWELVAGELQPEYAPPATRGDHAAPVAPVAPDVVFEPRIYAASASAVLQVLSGIPERCRTALVIGHQPAVQDLVLALAGEEGDGEALERAGGKFPTSAVAVLALPGGWARLEPGAAALTAFAVPRGPAPGDH
ncbi:histidine phosphatase family protein [Streptomyces sp. 769]|uniref:SixA phosphatase family protein n=1 Tax=Streptomyces sp. 769 TaxID=1262452 RepID=UPI00057E212B|nr:histidine phosphatase family protein [Streptomyces sp. 769]AJC61197.1 phosphohistidine phosphatase [Streptomyces sp. 769]